MFVKSSCDENGAVLERREKVENEQSFHLLFENANQGIFIIQDLKYKYVNEYGLRLLGCSGNKLNDVNMLQDVHPEDRDYLKKRIEDRLLGRTVEDIVEYRVYAANGKMKWIEAKGALTLWEGQAAILGFVTDISDQKQIEEDLRARDEKLRFLAENMGDIIWTVDENFNTTYVSPSIEKVLGFTPEERKKQTLEEMVTPGSIQVIQAHFEEELQKIYTTQHDPSQSLTVEVEYYKKDGSTIWLESKVKWILDAHGNMVGLHGVSRDISEQKMVREALQASEERLQAIFKANPDPVMVFDAKGNTQYLNPAFIEIFGWSVDDFREGKALFVPDDQVGDTDKIIDEVVHSGKTGRIQTRRSTKNGDLIDVILSAATINGPQGNHIGMMVNFTDITEQRKLEANFQQAQKMESVGRLAGGVAHDFNNMLGAISGYAELALQKIDASHSASNYLHEICKVTQHSADLTRQLLAFARKQTVAPRVIDMNEAISGMFKMLRRLIGEDINLTWKPGEELWLIKVDPAQIDQILANLCVNARDAIPGAGKIIIETQNEVLDEEYCALHPGAKPGQYAKLALSDDGQGMDKKTMEKIFEPFFTTKELGKGTGLGLATVYGIIKQNNGFIKVDSELDRGTTFQIFLPKTEEALKPETEIKPTITVKGSESVLVVEDDPSILAVCSEMLEQSGYNVLTACTPSEALEIVKQKKPQFQLLLTDVVMPEMNGKELKELLEKYNPNFMTLYMSGYTSDIMHHQGELEADTHFIQKPFSKNTVALKIRKLLDGSS